VRTRFLLAVAATATGLVVSTDALAFKVFEDPDKGIVVNVGVLVQPWFQFTKPKVGPPGVAGTPASPGMAATDSSLGQSSSLVVAPSTQLEGNGTGGSPAVNPSFDFFLRRARFIISGSMKDLSFFASVDQPDYGIGGSFGGLERNKRPFFIQDAFLTYQIAPEFKIDAGMMSVPFSRHTVESSGTLNTLDFHSDVVRSPTGKNYHDTGVQFRGTVGIGQGASGPLAINYRVGMFEGVRNLAAEETPVEPVGANYPKLNEKGIPRFAGQVRFTIGSESDFFMKGIYFSNTPIISFGVGADYQPNAVLKLAIPNDDPMLAIGPLAGTYTALSADVFIEYPMSNDQEVILKGNAFKYNEGWSRIEGSTLLETGGTAFFGEAGYRFGQFEPVLGVDYLAAKDSDVAPITQRDHRILSYHGGLNYWVSQHTFNLKLDVTSRTIQKEGRKTQTQMGQDTEHFTHQDLIGTLQAQVFF